jgi:hypothetical protein
MISSEPNHCTQIAYDLDSRDHIPQGLDINGPNTMGSQS